MSRTYALALHGGAGTIQPGTPDDETPYREALLAALATGQRVLAEGGSALDAVVATVVSLEDHPSFNAGHGAVFTANGGHELDAGIMDGRTLGAGAVAGVRTVRNPILAAREGLRDGRWVVLGGEGADAFASARGLDIVDASYFSTPHRLAQWRIVRKVQDGAVLDHDAASLERSGGGESAASSQRFGTVGAVALDRDGHLAAATSTGGLTNKTPGRIGDTPVIGAGVYANDATCAVSSTGTGEHFIRACIAYDVHARMHYLRQDVGTAARASIAESLGAIGGRGGIVAVGRDGGIAMPFNSTGMYRAWVCEGDERKAAIFAA